MIAASGGIVYHARAARGLLKLLDSFAPWTPTRRKVSSWVREWVKSHRFNTLILIGPSAAYLIEDNIWSEIEQLVVVEPDRLAEWIFKRRFPRPAGTNESYEESLVWIHRTDLLPYFSRETDEFARFLNNYDPETTGILFFGCLGQMPFHESEFSRKEEEARSLLLAATKLFATASLHDLTSVTVPGLSSFGAREISKLDLQLPALDCSPNVIQQLIGQVSERLENFEKAGTNLKASSAAPLVWTDHDTYWLGRPRAICPWTITAEQIHILGFVTK